MALTPDKAVKIVKDLYAGEQQGSEGAKRENTHRIGQLWHSCRSLKIMETLKTELDNHNLDIEIQQPAVSACAITNPW